MTAGLGRQHHQEGRIAFDLDGLAAPSRVVAAAPGASEIRLQRFFDRPVWRAETPEGARLFDARSGAPLPALTESQVRDQARRIYTGEGKIVSVRLLTKAPQEMQSRKPPYWQVEFEGWNRPTLYLSPTTGELISRRHALWRVFDFVWMLHIMDYENRTDVNNTLLRVASIVGLVFALSGIWLLFYSFGKRRSA